jgi:hypothetical protein
MKRLLGFIFIGVVYSASFGQMEPKYTFNVELGMPVPTSNKSFSGIMKGVFCLSPYFQYRLPNSLAFGAGLQYTYLQINPFKVPASEPAVGGLHGGGAFVKVSHEKFHGDQFATDFGVKFGYTQTYFITDLNETKLGKPLMVNSVTISPMLGLILSVDEFSSYRFTLGYSLQGYGFSPHRLGISTNGGYDVASFEKPTQYLVFGFGFTHYFKKQ